MKKFFKWASIVVLSIVLFLVLTLIGIFISHDRYWFYPTGGKVSELQEKYDTIYYDLNLEFNSEEQSIKGFVNVSLKSLSDNLETIELDLIDNFDISNIQANGTSLEFDHNDDKVLIKLQNSLKRDQEITLRITYSGQPIEAMMPPWVGGVNWSKHNETNDWIGVSCQGEGGKIWFPCKAHPSDEPDSVAINITAPDPYICASNGKLQKVTKPRDGFSTFHWLTKYPTNNYNISVNIAKYRVIEKSYTSVEGTEIPVVYYYLRDKEELADSLVNMAIDMLKTLEKYFGEYPYADEKFGLVETSYLGMEHQTINSYGNNYRFKERNGFNFDELMLHEMAHEWWGNKMTVAGWSDFWIHEGMGTYSEAIYLLDKLGEDSYHKHMAIKKMSIRNDSPILMEKYISSHSSYSGDIYTKGAYFMHSLRYALGDSIFFNTLYEFIEDSNYTYQNFVETQNFLNLVNKNSGNDYSPFFDLFLKTNDLPDVKIDSLGNNKWNVYVSNIDFTLPMDIEADGEVERRLLNKTPIEISSVEKISVDPKGWYLHAKDFIKK